MAPVHKEQLADVALFVAFTKASTISAVKRLLMAAQQQCMSYMQCMNTFEGDAEIIAIGEKIQALSMEIPEYSQRLITEFGGLDLDKVTTLSGEDIWTLREEEIKSRGGKADPGEPLPYEDPLDVHNRLTRNHA